MTHICVSKLTIIGSDNGLSPDWRQAIIWINAGILLIGPLGTNFSEILIEILTVSFKKMRWKVSSAKRRPFCLCLNVLRPLWGEVFIDRITSWLSARKSNSITNALELRLSCTNPWKCSVYDLFYFMILFHDDFLSYMVIYLFAQSNTSSVLHSFETQHNWLATLCSQ